MTTFRRMFAVGMFTGWSVLASAQLTGGFDSAKAAFDQGQWVQAAQAFDAEVQNLTSAKRAEAAAFALRSWRNAQRHDQVEGRYEACRQAALLTPFASQCKLERARSLHENAKDYAAASALYDEILAESPSDNFAAAGALLARADLKLKAHKDPDGARTDLNALLSSHSSSPFVDDARLGLLRCAVSVLNPTDAEAERERLAAEFPTSPLLSAADLELADFHNKSTGNTVRALAAYRRLVRNFPGSRGALTARLRLADDVAQRGNFRQAIADYQTIGQEQTHLSANHRRWIACQTGICHWQLDDADQARSAFESVLQVPAETGADPNPIKTAQLHLTALANPEGLEMIQVYYDRGLRWRASGQCRDLCWRDFYRLLDLSKRPFYEAWCGNQAIPAEERAAMRYRVALAAFELGDHDGVPDLVEKVLDLNPQGITRQMAQYLEAYHHGHCGHYSHAASIYREILDARPDHAYMVPQTYRELISALEASGDSLAAALACEEFRILYPYRDEVTDVEARQRHLVELNQKSVAQNFQVERDKLYARLRPKGPPLLLTDQNMPPKPLGPVTMATGVTK